MGNTSSDFAARKQTESESGFVAGTLVHTKEGLRAIEQIKVGDSVLSKPENGEEEPSYKPVLRTVEYGDKEVWYVPFQGRRQNLPKKEFFIVSTNQLFWVSEITNCGFAENVPEEIRKSPDICNAWLKTVDLYRQDMDLNGVVSKLLNGHEILFQYLGPMVGGIQTAGSTIIGTSKGDLDSVTLGINPADVGAVYWPESIGDGNDGIGIIFSKGCPEYLGKDSRGTPLGVFTAQNVEAYDCLDEDAVAWITLGHEPFLRKIYNLEVKEHHTYYVGEGGALVHDICQPA